MQSRTDKNSHEFERGPTCPERNLLIVMAARCRPQRRPPRPDRCARLLREPSLADIGAFVRVTGKLLNIAAMLGLALIANRQSGSCPWVDVSQATGGLAGSLATRVTEGCLLGFDGVWPLDRTPTRWRSHFLVAGTQS